MIRILGRGFKHVGVIRRQLSSIKSALETNDLFASVFVKVTNSLPYNGTSVHWHVCVNASVFR